MLTGVTSGQADVANKEARVMVGFVPGDYSNSMTAQGSRDFRANDVVRGPEGETDAKQYTGLEGTSVVVRIIRVVSIEDFVVRGTSFYARVGGHGSQLGLLEPKDGVALVKGEEGRRSFSTPILGEGRYVMRDD